MMDRFTFIQSLASLKDFIISGSTPMESICQKAYEANPWFIPSFTRQSLDAIADEFLVPEKCKKWLDSYPISSGKKRIGVIMAGNVPLVGFHDLLCVLASGHDAIIKLSEKDSLLMKFITDLWIRILPELKSCITYSDKLEGFDAVIATGSNNSARYFEYYFRDYPHILRQNRNGVAVLTGDETLEDLKQLAKDIFLFFGLGCRNVSKLFLPRGYDFHFWDEAVKDWKFLEDHTKYKNNLEYNYAIYIINGVPHINLGNLILKEDDAIGSRIGCVHYSYYENNNQLEELMRVHKTAIQCVVSNKPVGNWEHIPFGQSQWPKLDQYADELDTMKFLTSL